MTCSERTQLPWPLHIASAAILLKPVSAFKHRIVLTSNTTHSPTPQAPWPGVYYPLGPPQGLNFIPPLAFNPSPSFQQGFSFQNTFPATFNTSVPSQDPSTSRTLLGNITNAANTGRPARKKRKLQNLPDAEPSRSCRHLDPGPAPDAPSVFGVGPSTSAVDAAATASDSVFHPSLVNIPGINFGSLLEKPTGSGASATDVWTFVCGVHTDAAPPTPLLPLEMTPIRPDKKKFSHLACRCCSLDKWRTWKNVDGQTMAIRDHLKAAHSKVYREIVLTKKLKGFETLAAMTQVAPGEQEEFLLPGFYDWLVKWIAVDD
ncbi:hypothetical protein B0H10DRAFT_1938681 [Mycena sp. CBHHK59/15]|nr:hypothetical protein B0H10DRAFT_1938681 [Mycena sp. CBHHK59/15]